MNIDKIRDLHLYILAILFLVVSHITIKNFGSPLALPTAYLVWVMISATLLLSAVYAFIRQKFAIPYMWKYILIFLTLLILPVFFNPVINSHALIFETGGLIGGILFFTALHQFDISETEKETILYLILASAFIESLISLFQYFNPDTGIFLLVTAAHDQIYGNFQHQNLLASYLATSFVISLYLLSGTIFKDLKNRLKVLFYFAVLLITFILFLTGSRAGLIEAGIGVFILAAARYGYFKNKIAYHAVWLLIITIGITGSITAEKYYHNRDSALSFAGRKLENTVTSIAGDKVSDTRIPIYLTAFNMIKERPVAGHGPGNFSSRFMYYRSRLAQEHPEYPYEPAFTTHPHNEFLFRTVESGLFGGAGLLIVLSAFTFLLYKLGRERGGAYAAFLFPIAFHTQVGYPLYQSMPHWALFLLLLYLPSSDFVRHLNIKSNKLVRGSVLTLLTACFIFMLYFAVTTINAQVGMKKYQEMLMQGSVRPDLIEPALDNIYLRQLARRLYFDAGFRLGILQNDMEPIERFADFLLKEKGVFPHPDVFGRGSLALYLVGRRDEAYKLLDEGLSIYPGMASILKVKQNLQSADAKGGIRN